MYFIKRFLTSLILAPGDSSAGGIAYASLYKPTSTGSRGGGTYGGYGGGKVFIRVPAIILIDGNILADGADASAGSDGGGSGGSVFIEAGMSFKALNIKALLEDNYWITLT